MSTQITGQRRPFHLVKPLQPNPVRPSSSVTRATKAASERALKADPSAAAKAQSAGTNIKAKTLKTPGAPEYERAMKLLASNKLFEASKICDAMPDSECKRNLAAEISKKRQPAAAVSSNPQKVATEVKKVEAAFAAVVDEAVGKLMHMDSSGESLLKFMRNCILPSAFLVSTLTSGAEASLSVK